MIDTECGESGHRPLRIFANNQLGVSCHSGDCPVAIPQDSALASRRTPYHHFSLDIHLPFPYFASHSARADSWNTEGRTGIRFAEPDDLRSGFADIERAVAGSFLCLTFAPQLPHRHVPVAELMTQMMSVRNAGNPKNTPNGGVAIQDPIKSNTKTARNIPWLGPCMVTRLKSPHSTHHIRSILSPMFSPRPTSHPHVNSDIRIGAFQPQQKLDRIVRSRPGPHRTYQTRAARLGANRERGNFGSSSFEVPAPSRMEAA